MRILKVGLSVDVDRHSSYHPRRELLLAAPGEVHRPGGNRPARRDAQRQVAGEGEEVFSSRRTYDLVDAFGAGGIVGASSSAIPLFEKNLDPEALWEWAEDLPEGRELSRRLRESIPPVAPGLGGLDGRYPRRRGWKFLATRINSRPGWRTS